VVRTLWAQRTGPLFLQLEHHFDTPALWSAAIDEHQAVLDAIEAHDPAAARSAMRRHLQMAGRRFQRSFRH
jgi:DNA-binding GntR family transcriptional regulator